MRAAVRIAVLRRVRLGGGVVSLVRTNRRPVCSPACLPLPATVCMWLSPYNYYWYYPQRLPEAGPFSIHYIGKLGMMRFGLSVMQGFVARKYGCPPSAAPASIIAVSLMRCCTLLHALNVAAASSRTAYAQIAWSFASYLTIMDAAWATFEISSGRLPVSRWVVDAPTLFHGALCALLMTNTVWVWLGGLPAHVAGEAMDAAVKRHERRRRKLRLQTEPMARHPQADNDSAQPAAVDTPAGSSSPN